FGGVGNVPDALEHHLDQLVACLDLSVMEETEEQTPTPWPIQDIADITHVKGRGLRSKLLNLGVGNIAQKRLRGDDCLQPREAFRPLPEVCERRPARRIFEACELAPPGMDGHEGIEAGPLRLAPHRPAPRTQRPM